MPRKPTPTEALMQSMAEGLDDILNGPLVPGQKSRFGFVLLVAEFDKIEGGRVNWVSNGDRNSMLAMMREYLARAEGRYAETKDGVVQ